MHLVGIFAAVFLALVAWSRWEEWRIRRAGMREITRMLAKPKPARTLDRRDAMAIGGFAAVVFGTILILAFATH